VAVLVCGCAEGTGSSFQPDHTFVATYEFCILEDDIAAAWAVNSRIDEDHPCLPHTRYWDRQHDVATEV